MESIPDYGELMTIIEFVNAVESGCFVDYDGYGYFATDKVMDSTTAVFPSSVKNNKSSWPAWATHVVWFNK